MPGKRDICVDLDGVLAEYNGWKGYDHFGDPLPGAVEFTKKLSELGRVVIFTTRACPLQNEATPQELKKKIETWLQKHGFHFDSVYIGVGKPPAAAYIDDRAVQCRPQIQRWGPQTEFRFAAAEVKRLIEGEK